MSLTGSRAICQLAGKSTLLTRLTGTESAVAAYEFTTLTCIPGSFKYKGCKIQLLDLPGIIEGAKDGKGRGRQVIAVARTCNLILIVLDAAKPMTHKRIIEKELEGFGIRLNEQPPQIVFNRKERGGINITYAVPCTKLDNRMITSVCKEYRIVSADITLREDASVDQLIDVIEGNRKYVGCLYVLNKIDAITIEELELLSRVPHYVPIAAGLEWNFDDLLESVWSYLNMKRIYTKPKGQIPDYDSPVVVPADRCTVEQFCLRIHKSLLAQFKHALVWGQITAHSALVLKLLLSSRTPMVCHCIVHLPECYCAALRCVQARVSSTTRRRWARSTSCRTRTSYR